MCVPSNETYARLPLCNQRSTIKEWYSQMFAIRNMELSLLNLFKEGVLSGTTHTCLGQEATAVGVLSAIDRDRDLVFSNHRGHGHFLAYCGEIERLLLEIFGKKGGVCAGRGGSQHLQFKNFYSNGIQGGMLPVALGTALVEKRKASGAIAIVFLGDGTCGEGVVYECFNIASLWELPVLFIIEDNGISQSTPSAMNLAGQMIARLTAFDISVEEYKTTDVREVFKRACNLVESVRSEKTPRCLIINNYRLGPHSKGDDFRDPSEIQKAWESEPLVILRSAMDAKDIEQIELETSEFVGKVIDSALKA